MKTSATKSLVIVSGALANKLFNGGNAWTRLSWVLGLQRFGFEVLFIEQIAPEACVDDTGATCDFEHSANLAYFRATMTRFGLERASALICGEDRSWGLPMADLISRAGEAQLLFNLSGHLTHPEIKATIGSKVYYDDDPGFTQFWHAVGSPGARLDGHDFYFTLGQNIGTPECAIPVGSISWRHTRPPVVLEHWPCVPSREFDRFTTVASWRGAYGPIEHGGKKLGQKAHEFRKFLSLPQRTNRKFEVALDIHPGDHKDLEALQSRGWTVIDPRKVARSPEAYRAYLQGSAAEFSPAQGVYVQTNSGWSSDRTARYLASGRPVLVQDTGLSSHYPVGEGLVCFSNVDEAIEGVERITRDYPLHCAAARKVAEEYFDSDKVISELLAEIGLKPGSQRTAGQFAGGQTVTTKRTIIVSGMVAATPWQGGATWAVLQYVLGFRRLGYDVYLVEPLAAKDIKPTGAALGQSENARYFEDLLQAFALGGKAALLLSDSRETVGLSYSELEQVAGRTDVLINISGMLTDEHLLDPIPVRVYLDLDPAFNQLWSAAQGIDMRFATHTHHVSIGLNLGESDCPVPTCGIKWLKTLQPVCLEHWPVANGASSSAANPPLGAVTTVGNWRGYGSITHEGIHYGQKAHSLRQFLDLPKMVPEKFRLALSIHPAETEDLARLEKHGWELVDPAQVTRTPFDYRQFIQNSKAEFGVCKSGYAASQCGWFSDRSICYLASGRPVVAQNTGFDQHLPCGKGLLAFATTEEAAEAIRVVNADYAAHRAAARRIVEEHFDSDKVLRRLLTLF